MKRCPNCGREFSDANRFCGGCGGPLVAATEAAGLGRCPNCDTPLRPNWKFCGKCQTPLAVGQADARPSPANWEPSPRPPADAPVALRCPACLLAVEDDGGDFCEHCGVSLQAADVPQALPPDPTPQLPAYGPALAPAQAAASPSHEATPSEATPVGDAQTPGGRFLAFTEPATGEELRPEEATADEPCPSPPAGAASSAAVTADVNLGADPPPETRENPSVQPSQAAWEESVGAVRAPAANDDSGAPARAESSGAAERADSSGPAEEFVLPRYDEPPSGDLFEGSLAADRSPLRKWLVPGGAALCLLLVAGVLLLRSGARSEVKADATPTPAATPAPPPEGMVLVPDGAFRMGRDGGDPYESPTHEVTVKAFYLDAHEVTCEQYAKFIAETRHAPPQTWPGGRYDPTEARLPVTGVSWADAQAYAAWAGKRLPTE
ncbi:MAG TPA: SUMF1/EgtB/PvdO family nonheme iron enzyme, partial [Pyrinomonadaceae bacterium]|nr:SUMF1/EgtB/PvdO family nonheme iron enzyme [Pyrinomonadaceae bacterium]